MVMALIIQTTKVTTAIRQATVKRLRRRLTRDEIYINELVLQYFQTCGLLKTVT